ncbi:hypothetical protein F4781DRAFT_291695 [Annulohypoxylon bovei var. microspora]|nr:hypothetical protein F4781DRAFT_291695 [Annulohypoxylon bovei var. microspora]
MSVVDEDIRWALAMAGFAGVSWYLGVEISVSLFLLFKRRRGLYFWSCALGIWGVILQTLFIILADFGIWNSQTAPIAMIYLTWAMMIIPQSWILYSRLHLITQQPNILSWVRVVLVFNSIAVSSVTIVLGTLAQTVRPSLFPVNNIWDRLQTTIFFVQETTLSILYIWQTRKYLRDLAPLLKTPRPSSDSIVTIARIEKKKNLLHHLIYTNILIICLDITLLGIQNANLFYLAGAFKPAVYGVKLKLEFVILNRLIKSLPGHHGSTMRSHDGLVVGSGSPDNGSVEKSRPWEAHRPVKVHAADSTFDMGCLDVD